MMGTLSWNSLGLVVAGLCLSVPAAWWCYHRLAGLSLSTWRKRTLSFGLIGNSVSLALYLADLVRYRLIMQRAVAYTGSGWADSGWVLLGLIALGVASGICGTFGRRVARLLTMANGIVLAALWCFLGAGTSA